MHRDAHPTYSRILFACLPLLWLLGGCTAPGGASQPASAASPSPIQALAPVAVPSLTPSPTPVTSPQPASVVVALPPILSPDSRTPWSTSPQEGPEGDPSLYYLAVADISVVSPDEAWAVVDETEHVSIRIMTRGAIYHYVDGSWQLAARPEGWQNAYGCGTVIDMLGPDDGWTCGFDGGVYACGGYGSSLGRYRDGGWQKQETPRWTDCPPGDATCHSPNIYDLDMVEAGLGWAVARDFYETRSVVLRYEQGQWRVEFESPSELNLISMADSQAGWAVATYDANPERQSVYHYHDGTWSPTEGTTPLGVRAIEAVSGDEAWAVGCAGGQPLLWHFAAGNWRIEPVPFPAGCLLDVDFLNGDEGWALGVLPDDGTYAPVYKNGFSGGQHPILLHYASGDWREVDTRLSWPATSVAAIAPNEVWVDFWKISLGR